MMDDPQTTGFPDDLERRRFVRTEGDVPVRWWEDPTKMMLIIFVEVSFVLIAVITATVLVLVSLAEAVANGL